MTDNGSPTDANATSGSAEEFEFPIRLRVHALARTLGLTSRQVLAHLAELGIETRSPQSSIDREAAQAVAERVRAHVEVDETTVDAVEDTAAAVSDGPEAESETAEQRDGPTLFSAVEDARHQPFRPVAEEPVATQPLFLQPQAVDQPHRAPRPDRDTDAADGTGAATTTQSDDDDGAGDGERTSRRRRRGRRGRGRGRGDQGDGGVGPNDTADSAGGDNTENAAQQHDERGKKGAKSDRSAEDAEAGGSGDNAAADNNDDSASDDSAAPSSKRRRRRRRRKGGSDPDDKSPDDPPNTVVHEREPRSKRARDEVQGISGSTRLEAKRQRRRDGRDAGRRRPPILSESEFLARREAVDRVMVVRERSANSKITVDAADRGSAPVEDYTQVAVLEDGILVEHFVTTETSSSMVGNIYLGRVQNVLPGMEAAFVDIGRGRNGVLYAGEVNWDAAGLDGGSRKIEQALKPGDNVLVQVSKDPVGHKGARLTTQISLAGRYLVYVPGGSSTGISRKLPDVERKRLKSILGKLVPAEAGVIIRTASEGVSAEDLGADIERLEKKWNDIDAAVTKAKGSKSSAPKALYEEPNLLVRVVRDLFNEDFKKLVVEGGKAWDLVERYISDVAPDLMERIERFEKPHADAPDSFSVYRIDEQLAKALDRKVWLPSGGTLIIEHTEAMTVIDVNTGKFTGSGGNLEETVTRNNLEAAEEIVRQMRLRDIGGMIIVDFIDMVLESNRDLVLRRLTEALARDRTRHQVSEVTSLGLVQMTRKRIGTGLLEAFSTTCSHCAGRGIVVHANPVEVRADDGGRGESSGSKRSRRNRRKSEAAAESQKPAHNPAEHPMFRAMAAHAHDHDDDHDHDGESAADAAESTAATDSDTRTPDTSTDTSTTEQTAVAEPSSDTPAVAESEEQASTSDSEAPASAGGSDEKTPAAETTTETKPAAKRRRRVVRQAAAPPVASSASTPRPEDDAESAPRTTFGAGEGTGSEPSSVAVRRRPRRRTAGRPAGPPPADEQ